MKKLSKLEKRDAEKRAAYRRYIFKRIWLGLFCAFVIGLMLLSVFVWWIPNK